MILSMVLEFDGCSDCWLLMILTTALPPENYGIGIQKNILKNSSNSHQSGLGLGKHDDACVDQKHRPCRMPSASQAFCPWITRPLALQRHHTAEPATSLCPVSWCCIIHEYPTSWHLTHILFLFIGLESLVAAHRTTSDRFWKAVSNSWWLVLFYKFPVGSLNFCQLYSMAACCDLHLTLSSAVFKTRFHVLLPSFLQDDIGIHWPCNGAGDCGSSCIAQVKPKGAVPMRSKNELSGAGKTFWVLHSVSYQDANATWVCFPNSDQEPAAIETKIWASWKQPPGIPSFPNISLVAPLQELHRLRAAWWPLQIIKTHTHTKMPYKNDLENT